MVKKKVGLCLLGVLVVSLLAYFVLAGANDIMYPKIVEAIGDSTTSLLNPTSSVGSAHRINISGSAYNLTIVTRNNGTHGVLISNMSLMWYPVGNGSDSEGEAIILNLSFHNGTGSGIFGCITSAGPGWNCTNRTFWNQTFDTTSLTDGVYNLSIMVFNFSDSVVPTATGINHTYNNTLGVNITIDNTPPNHSGSGFGAPYALNLSTTATNNMLNLSGGVIQIKASINDTTTFVKSLKFGIYSYRNATQFNASASINASFYTLDLVLTPLLDGMYNITMYANDTLDNINYSLGAFVGNLSFRYDNVAPNVSAIGRGGPKNGRINNFTNGVNFSAGLSGVSANLIITSLNVTVNDTMTVQRVRFNLSNNSGVIGYWNATLNSTGIWNLTVWNLTYSAVGIIGGQNFTAGLFNISALAEGRYYLTIWANDSMNNINYTENFTFQIDRTLPTVTVTCGDGTFTDGETVTCTCTSADGTGTGIKTAGRFSNGDSSESTTAVGTSGTSSTCEAIDHAGQINTATASWTVSEAESAGSGSTGSGGGSSSGATGAFEKMTWTSINAGEVAKVTVDNSAIGVTEVSFKVDTTVWGAWVSVNKKDSLPSSVGSTGGKVYRNLEITKGPVLKDELMKEAIVNFKVGKSWLTENGLGKNEIVLLRYHQDKWGALATTVGEDDGAYIHYTAMTPGFSYFVIGTKGTAELVERAVGEEAEEEAETAGEAAVEETATGEGVAAEIGRTGLTAIVIVVVIVAVLAVLWYIYKRKR